MTDILAFLVFIFRLNNVLVFILAALAAFLLRPQKGKTGPGLFNFGKTTFVDISNVIFNAAAFLALVKKIGMTYILLTGAILSILLFGFLV